MSPQEFIDLYEKYLSGNCTPEEINQLEAYRDNFELKDLPWNDRMGNKEEVRLDILYHLKNNITASKKSFKGYWIAAAAMLIFAVSLLWVIGNRAHNGSTEIVKNSSVGTKGPVIPGNNKATLTLSDGSNIDLTDSKKGLLSKQGSVAVGKSGEGEIVYNAKHGEAKSVVALYNIISTPRGGQYQVVLSDGTKVWLNAASSIKFPTVFTGHERKVELTGEAYFEVAKNKDMPFKVAVDHMSVEVLGTHFNVDAYKDEEVIKTTLLEGAVKLVTSDHQAYLKPGQQATLNQQQSFNIRSVNTEEAIAWKNGYFIFNNENIQSIMRKVSRWYDVEVVYNGKVDERDFGGTVSRFDSVADVLKSLELTGTVHFKMEGRRIIVMP
ncbi:FecR family protein [Mucilaginibacter lappiensis]|uniref:Ferric-dicitrate binding protein FerR (Iron transport regulator) n=1 Tax=Mucilaginibacter lappiensis TaxID=354630 RepID=A0ABR6PS22_9SPHI|nr:FecR family protein [Mucilaginibacter lappiensis]MBB6112539.1 ferric-dicitrate binding protein FerR (iron transport regulator) [Mucilaginibacter lappiensis]SIS02876.1 FecR family protein [Mucilaginibacter lappiensis]